MLSTGNMAASKSATVEAWSEACLAGCLASRCNAGSNPLGIRFRLHADKPSDIHTSSWQMFLRLGGQTDRLLLAGSSWVVQLLGSKHYGQEHAADGSRMGSPDCFNSA